MAQPQSVVIPGTSIIDQNFNSNQDKKYQNDHQPSNQLQSQNVNHQQQRPKSSKSKPIIMFEQVNEERVEFKNVVFAPHKQLRNVKIFDLFIYDLDLMMMNINII